MQDIKIYILIEDKTNDSEVRIDGNLETLRGLLYTLRAPVTDPTPNPVQALEPLQV